jgi:primase-polymerase (primpol)-like protein
MPSMPPDERRGEIAIYDRGRYLTITGHKLAGASGVLEVRQEEIDKAHRQYFPPKLKAQAQASSSSYNLTIGDEEILALARAAKNRGKFSALYDRGEWKGLGFPSRSEADLALCSMLAFWCDADKARVDKLFRASGLNRPKWEERPDYRERTLEAAIATCTETYKSSWQSNMNGTDGTKVCERAS